MRYATLYIQIFLEVTSMKNISISIRLDSQLKEKTESVLVQFGLNMTTIVNMLFHQIVREQAIPLSLSLSPRHYVMDDLNAAKSDRIAGYMGRTADCVANDMEQIINEAENV
jgi:addiction module RelB/DinJ family antitoxin